MKPVKELQKTATACVSSTHLTSKPEDLQWKVAFDGTAYKNYIAFG